MHRSLRENHSFFSALTRCTKLKQKTNLQFYFLLMSTWISNMRAQTASWSTATHIDCGIASERQCFTHPANGQTRQCMSTIVQAKDPTGQVFATRMKNKPWTHSPYPWPNNCLFCSIGRAFQWHDAAYTEWARSSWNYYLITPSHYRKMSSNSSCSICHNLNQPS